MLKIGLIGTGGCGSTTIAKEVSSIINIPFIKSSDMTKIILKRDNYDYEPNHFVEKFLSEKNREFELINLRINQEHELNNFITDRTTLENFVYALDSLENYTMDELNIIHEKCFNNMKNYTHLFYLKRRENIKNNGIRTINVFYQRNIDYLIKGTIKDWNLNVIELYEDINLSIETIINSVKQFI